MKKMRELMWISKESIPNRIKSKYKSPKVNIFQGSKEPVWLKCSEQQAAR